MQKLENVRFAQSSPLQPKTGKALTFRILYGALSPKIQQGTDTIISAHNEHFTQRCCNCPSIYTVYQLLIPQMHSWGIDWIDMHS